MLEICKHTAMHRSASCVVSRVMFSFSVRTFVTEFKLKKTFLNTTMEKHSDLREVENEITGTVSFLKSTFLWVLCFLEQISFRIGNLVRTSCISWAIVHFHYIWEVNFMVKLKASWKLKGGAEIQWHPGEALLRCALTCSLYQCLGVCFPCADS